MDLGSCNNHYFYDVDMKEDFYRCIAPSEDIWKKFELVPGFTLSPGGCPGGGETDWAAEMMDLGWESPLKLTGLSSVVLLRDCMWSGFSTRERLEKVIHERLSTGSPRVTNTQKPVADNETSEPRVDAIEQIATPLVVPTPIPEKVPNSSGSESTSDSEEDAIDVVTVEKRKSYGGRQPVTITVRADPTATKLFHISIHQQQHNYAARLPPDPNTMSPQHNFHSTVQEEPGEVTSPELQPCSPQMPDSPLASGSSDSEDLAKRKNHNYLERKRRNDLRSRFLALRDEVPSLARSTKNPKVVVLSKATEFLKGLVIQEQQLTAEKLKLWSRHQQLLRRISQLKGR